MFIKKLNLEKYLFEEKKDFASLLAVDIDTEVESEESGITNLLKSISEKEVSLKYLKKSVSGISEYKKEQTKNYSNVIKELNFLKKKNNNIVKKIDKLIQIYNKKANKKPYERINNSNLKNNFILEKLIAYKSQLKSRIESIISTLETYTKDKSWATDMNEDQLRATLSNNIVLMEQTIDNENKLITTKRERIKILRDLKDEVKHNEQFKFS
jgi:hypothetical protein